MDIDMDMDMDMDMDILKYFFLNMLGNQRENFSRIRALESLYTEEQTECGVCVLSVVVEM